MFESLYIDNGHVVYRGQEFSYSKNLLERTNRIKCFYNLSVIDHRDGVVTVAADIGKGHETLRSVRMSQVDISTVISFADQFKDVFNSCFNRNLLLKSLVLNEDYIFYDPQTSRFYFLYLPFTDLKANNTQQLDFFKNISSLFQPTDAEAGLILAKLRGRIKPMTSFNPVAIRDELEQIVEEAKLNLNKHGAAKISDPVTAANASANNDISFDEPSGPLTTVLGLDSPYFEPQITKLDASDPDATTKFSAQNDPSPSKDHNQVTNPQNEAGCLGGGSLSQNPQNDATQDPNTGTISLSNAVQNANDITDVSGGASATSEQKKQQPPKPITPPSKPTRGNTPLSNSPGQTPTSPTQSPGRTEPTSSADQPTEHFPTQSPGRAEPTSNSSADQPTEHLLSNPIEPTPDFPVTPDFPAIPSKQKTRLFLTRISTGERFEVTGQNFLVGKSMYASYQVKNTNNVSRQHAFFGIDGSRCWVRDNKSKNGTAVGGKRLAPQESRELHDGDVVVLSEERFRVEIIPAPVATKNR